MTKQPALKQYQIVVQIAATSADDAAKQAADWFRNHCDVTVLPVCPAGPDRRTFRTVDNQQHSLLIEVSRLLPTP